jgi:2-polyprenyl-3-methyl-5-hydroxy-6-metoxy-1,4-benzoquinol methylase
MKITVNKPCFVCGSTNSQLLFEREYPSHHYPGKFTIRKCNKCGLLFNSPRLPDEELSNLYAANYYFFQRHDSDEFRRILDVYLRTVSLIQNGIIERRVAEIGSAKGYLLALLKRLGWNVQGIEISPEASEYAISRFGVPTFTGTIEDYSNNNHKDIFPVVLAIDVIEHVPNPIDFLNSVDSILSNKGLLIIDTPNGNSQNIEYLSSKWNGFNPFHIYLFSSEILQSLLSNMGYTIEKCFSYGNRCEFNSTNSEEFKLKELLKSILLRLGIFEQSKIVYRQFINLAKQREKDLESMITNAIEIVRKSTTYLDTDDARDDLAKEIRGDNIVIIARKTA